MNFHDVRFSDSARELLAQAQAEAQRLRHEYIGTEHLVIAMTSQTQGTAATMLLNQHIDLEGVRGTIESIVFTGRAAPLADRALPFTTRTQKVFTLAEESGLSFGRSEVGPEHLLIGILREAKGVGGQALVHHGVSLDVIIDEVKRMNSASPP